MIRMSSIFCKWVSIFYLSSHLRKDMSVQTYHFWMDLDFLHYIYGLSVWYFFSWLNWLFLRTVLYANTDLQYGLKPYCALLMHSANKERYKCNRDSKTLQSVGITDLIWWWWCLKRRLEQSHFMLEWWVNAQHHQNNFLFIKVNEHGYNFTTFLVKYYAYHNSIQFNGKNCLNFLREKLYYFGTNGDDDDLEIYWEFE